MTPLLVKRDTIRRTPRETIMTGLRCDPLKCPRCGAGLFCSAIDINLTESVCACGYSVKDRVGSVRDAEDIRLAAQVRPIVTRVFKSRTYAWEEKAKR